MTKALFIGRFQPLHKAHLKDIKEALKEHDQVIIAIGSSEKSHDHNNPFTFEERKEMIKETLDKENIKKYEIFPVPDINDDKRWVSHVIKIVKHFDVVYTGNPKTEKLFKEANIKVKKVEMIEGITSTTVRKHMLEDKDWNSLVPETVRNYIEKKKGHDRVKDIHR